MVCASDKAIASMKTAKSRRCYYDFAGGRCAAPRWPAVACCAVLPRGGVLRCVSPWRGCRTVHLTACPPACAPTRRLPADMLRLNPSGNVPYTPSLPLLYGMQASLKLLRDEGMQNVVARHHRWGKGAGQGLGSPGDSEGRACAGRGLPCLPSRPHLTLPACSPPPPPDPLPPLPRRLAEGCRKAVEGWGLQTLCRDTRWKSDSLTVIEVPKGIDSQKIVDVAYAK